LVPECSNTLKEFLYHIIQRALHIRKRALYISMCRSLFIYINKSLATYLERGSYRVLISFKEPSISAKEPYTYSFKGLFPSLQVSYDIYLVPQSCVTSRRVSASVKKLYISTKEPYTPPSIGLFSYIFGTSKLRYFSKNFCIR